MVAYRDGTRTAACLFVFIFLSGTTPLWCVVGVLVLLGLGYGFFSSPNTNAIMSSVDRRHYGVASSMVATMRAIGQMTSMALVMMIFSLVIERCHHDPGGLSPLPGEPAPDLQRDDRALRVLLFGIYASVARGKVKDAKNAEKCKNTGKKYPGGRSSTPQKPGAGSDLDLPEGRSRPIHGQLPLQNAAERREP